MNRMKLLVVAWYLVAFVALVTGVLLEAHVLEGQFLPFLSGSFDLGLVLLSGGVVMALFGLMFISRGEGKPSRGF
jgi:hypothetical protein